jgi:hypothetical protein
MTAGFHPYRSPNSYPSASLALAAGMSHAHVLAEQCYSRLCSRCWVVFDKSRATPKINRVDINHRLNLPHRIDVSFSKQYDVAYDGAIGCKEAGVILGWV